MNRVNRVFKWMELYLKQRVPNECQFLKQPRSGGKFSMIPEKQQQQQQLIYFGCSPPRNFGDVTSRDVFVINILKHQTNPPESNRIEQKTPPHRIHGNDIHVPHIYHKKNQQNSWIGFHICDIVPWMVGSQHPGRGLDSNRSELCNQVAWRVATPACQKEIDI